jgi:hypothetical protein
VKILPVISNVEGPPPSSGAIASSPSNCFACNSDGDVFQKMVSSMRTLTAEETVGRNGKVFKLVERNPLIEQLDDLEMERLVVSKLESGGEDESFEVFEVNIESIENTLQSEVENSIAETAAETLPVEQNCAELNFDPKTIHILDRFERQDKDSDVPITSFVDNAPLGSLFSNDLDSFWIKITNHLVDFTNLTKMPKLSLESPFVISKTESTSFERDKAIYFDRPIIKINRYLPKWVSEVDIPYDERATVISHREKQSIVGNFQNQKTKELEDGNPENFQKASSKGIVQQGFSQESVLLDPGRLAIHSATPTEGAVVAKIEGRNGHHNFQNPYLPEGKIHQPLKELVDFKASMQLPFNDKLRVVDTEQTENISSIFKATSDEMNLKLEPWNVDRNQRPRSQFDNRSIVDNEATRRAPPSAGSLLVEPPIDEIAKRIIGSSLKKHPANSVELSFGYDSFLRLDVSPTIGSDRSQTARLTAPVLDSIKTFVQRLPDVPRDHLVSAIVEDALTLRVSSHTDTVDIRFVSDNRDSLDLLVRHQTQLEVELKRFGVESFALSFGLKGEDRRSQRSDAGVQEETEVAASSVADTPKTGGFATPIGVDRRI